MKGMKSKNYEYSACRTIGIDVSINKKLLMKRQPGSVRKRLIACLSTLSHLDNTSKTQFEGPLISVLTSKFELGVAP